MILFELPILVIILTLANSGTVQKQSYPHTTKFFHSLLSDSTSNSNTGIRADLNIPIQHRNMLKLPFYTETTVWRQEGLHVTFWIHSQIVHNSVTTGRDLWVPAEHSTMLETVSRCSQGSGYVPPSLVCSGPCSPDTWALTQAAPASLPPTVDTSSKSHKVLLKRSLLFWTLDTPRSEQFFPDSMLLCTMPMYCIDYSLILRASKKSSAPQHVVTTDVSIISIFFFSAQVTGLEIDSTQTFSSQIKQDR